MTYRPELDGLRAVAVLAVLLFHATGALPGGFAGVDVFFVISGYVITCVIAGDLDAGRFSVAGFYERRVRRIAPALVATILATALASAFILMPIDLKSMGRSAAAAALMVSNILFWNESGYFDAAAQTKPLLHTWSLGIEEQFYLLYPLLVSGLWRRARSALTAALLAMFVASLAAAAWMTADEPSTAFYLAPFRFWELALGGLIALRPMKALERAPFAWIGLAMIAASFAVFDATTPFPGLPALLPTVGAALVINGARGASLAARTLGSRPFTFVGKISYSLYLVHWPLIVLLEYRQGARLDAWQGAAVVAGSIALAWISWRVVEQPFRRPAGRGSRLAVFGGAGAAAALCCAAGAVFVVTNGLPERLPPDVRQIYSMIGDDWPENAQCFVDTKGTHGPQPDDIRAGRLCSMGPKPTGRPDFLVWGDSHAPAIAPGIFAAADRVGARGLIVGAGACPPLVDFRTLTARDATNRRCAEINAAALDLMKSKEIPLVFMVARWPRSAAGNGYGDEGLFFDPADIAAPIPGEDLKFKAALEATLARLQEIGVRPVIVMDVPEAGYNVPYELARAKMAGRSIDVDPTRAVYRERVERAREIITAAAEADNAEIVDPTRWFCDDDDCDVQRNGLPLYRDTDHITRQTALALSPFFDDAFGRAMAEAGESARRIAQ
ncbi:acyltransferase family protein [Hansschlegelia plantiphila]|uniref:Acyltransferase n=1 Tax=Hansschlegelia plantiphila TaxID=374655 RepID=A0A9W6IXQ5_9HYPH|nr:acyltransferase family protein [Hansschlegelia plantiphila]GLK67095.1 acyltransferase [Hansschlegelia plantiphila]